MSNRRTRDNKLLGSCLNRELSYFEPAKFRMDQLNLRVVSLTSTNEVIDTKPVRRKYSWIYMTRYYQTDSVDQWSNQHVQFSA